VCVPCAHSVLAVAMGEESADIGQSELRGLMSEASRRNSG
jgi:hypothetical protein